MAIRIKIKREMRTSMTSFEDLLKESSDDAICFSPERPISDNNELRKKRALYSPMSRWLMSPSSPVSTSSHYSEFVAKPSPLRVCGGRPLLKRLWNRDFNNIHLVEHGNAL